MTNEIKEILDKLKYREETYKFCKQYKLVINDWTYEAHYLLDYITNLQTIEQQYSAILSENAELGNKITNLQEENEKLNGVINEIQWKPIDEYFKNKYKYDWVLVKYYDKYNFECIPSVAEYRFDNWYLKDNEKSLQDFEVRYFFDMQQLDKLTKIKGEDK